MQQTCCPEIAVLSIAVTKIFFKMQPYFRNDFRPRSMRRRKLRPGFTLHCLKRVEDSTEGRLRLHLEESTGEGGSNNPPGTPKIIFGSTMLLEETFGTPQRVFGCCLPPKNLLPMWGPWPPWDPKGEDFLMKFGRSANRTLTKALFASATAEQPGMVPTPRKQKA